MQSADQTDMRTALALGTAATQDSTAFATAAQGSLADAALQPGDNVSTLTNDAGYITSAAITGKADKTTTISAGTGLTGGGDLSANRSLALSAGSQASLALADSALQSGDPATDIAVDDSAFEVIQGANVQAALASADIAILNARATGIRWGGVLSVNGGVGVGTTVDVSAGAGQILDNSDAENPTFTEVTWTAFTGVTVITTPGLTWWYIDSSGALQQQTTEPTPEDRRLNIFLGRTSWTGSVITGVSRFPDPVQQEIQSLHDLASVLGPMRSSGSEVTYSGANLKLKITAGRIFDYGTNWPDYTDPHIVSIPTFDTGVANTFRYVTTSGIIATDVTDIAVANYQVGGVVTAIPGATTRVGIHYVFGFPGGNVRVAYGLKWYNSLTEAAAALATTNPYAAVPASFQNNSFVLGAVLALKSATDLSNTSQATFFTTNKFGLFGGAAAGAAVSGALQAANNLSDLTNAATARTNLGVAIGTNVQAYDADLAAIAGLSPTKGNLIVGNGSTWVALGVGTNGQVPTADSAQSTGIAWQTPGGGGGGNDVQVFTTSGTWNKPSGKTYYRAILIAPGAGGGGGARQAAGVVSGGGGGGGAGQYFIVTGRISDLGATEAVTIGAAGTGGAGATSDNSNGSTANHGGNATFASWTATGGRRGVGGSTSGGAGGGSATANGGPIEFRNTTAAGGAGGGASGPSIGSTVSSLLISTPGGGGGGLTAANAEQNGAMGGTIQSLFVTTDITGGSGGTTGGVRNGSNGNTSASLVGTGGGGGASGDAGGTVAGGNGGNGIGYGAGAGGGGGARNGANGGTGGTGGPGIIIIESY